MNESELREELAPKVVAKLVARCPGLAAKDAEPLAHELIAMVQGAVLVAQSGGVLGGTVADIGAGAL